MSLFPEKIAIPSHIDTAPGIFESHSFFTPEERMWRREVNDLVSGVRPTRTDGTVTSQRDRLSLIDHALASLRIINYVLRLAHNTPRWGNKSAVIDELVYILLSNRSKIEDAGRQFNALKKSFPNWEELVHATHADVRKIIYGGGLEDAKVGKLQGALGKILKRFGRISEQDLNQLDNRTLYEFLIDLPGVGPKTADCVLMYTRGHDVFPADAHCIRVLERISLFKPLGFSWKQEQHKLAQRDLSVLIPPRMRSDLHRNLVAHGRKVCKSSPLCNICEIRKFCEYYRHAEQEKESQRSAPTVIDMYSGAGGFSEGFHQAGFKIVAAIDLDAMALQTLKLNHPEVPDSHVLQVDTRKLKMESLKEILGDRRLDVLIGGPPCQGFSMIGNRVRGALRQKGESGATYYDFDGDPRNKLYFQMIKVAKELKPRYVVIENVYGLKSARSGEESYATLIEKNLQRYHYKVSHQLLKSENFGIPQRRHRIFIVGSYEGEPEIDLRKLSQVLEREKQSVLSDALAGLPSIPAGGGDWMIPKPAAAFLTKLAKLSYLVRFRVSSRGKILWNHVSRYNNPQDLELFAALKPGEDYRELHERVGKKPFMRYSFKNFHDKYFRLDSSKPSRTIMAHLAKDGNGFIHPFENRTISVREAARIQSFPDDYIFCGSRSAQFVQIGNAVPPGIAKQIAQLLIETSPTIRNILDGKNEKTHKSRLEKINN